MTLRGDSTETQGERITSRQSRRWIISGAVAAGAMLIAWTWSGSGSRAQPVAPGQGDMTASEHVMAQTPERAGRYLVTIGGCNDCHTPGFTEKGPEVPEGEWLTGVPLGWRGPWGTTYASNLRIFVKHFNEDMWVRVLRARNIRPPMPWASIHAMSDADMKAIYAYIKSLPVKGEKMPDYVPPEQEPKTPYVVMAPPQMPTGGGK